MRQRLSEAKFFDLIEEVDKILVTKAINGAISFLARVSEEEAVRKYFFENLDYADWLKPLFENGFFSNPPKTQKDPSRGTTRFLPWPESRYLVRMASKKPELVLEVVCNIPATDNVAVHEDLAEASLAMPPRLSAAWAEKETGWIKEQNHLISVLPRTLGKLISYLARGGEIKAALDLARALLEVLPDSKLQMKTKEDEDHRFSLPPKPTVRFDQWNYEEVLNKNIPDLVKIAGDRAVELIADLLETAVRYSLSDGEEKSPVDYSWIWRPAIEDHSQNRHRGLRDVLTTSLRDACESLIQKEKVDLRSLIDRLGGRPWHIFHRIALHLLRCFPDSKTDLIAEHLTDRSKFDEAAFRHEYSLLLNDCFGLLSAEQQKVILGWIEQGPDLDEFKKRRERITGKQPTDEDAQRHSAYWQRDHLAWFKTSLPEDWKERYENLVAELGEPDHAGFASYSGGTWVGPTSPKSAEELQDMTIPKIIEFCRGWKPSGESMTPSKEGLGRVLSSVVSEQPGRFLEKASDFQGLHSTYVRALLSGLRDALGKGQTFDWKPVFDLCIWVIGQPIESTDEDSGNMDEDPHWGWARKTIADFLAAGFKEGQQCIPFELRKTVWTILKPLTEDPDPTPEYEAEDGDSNMDPATLSINTTRGEAMHGLVQYALWVRRNLEKQAKGKELLARGFDEMPEVRDILEAHLDISQDPSVAIRTVYGQWFPWLALLDSQWAEQNASRIFPAEGTERSLWDAAWNAYITHCQAYDNVFETLIDQYGLAIDRLSEEDEETDSYADPQARLGEHLMVFFWRGKLDLDQPGSFFVRFFEKASPLVRESALRFVGRSLQNTTGDVPPAILDRLKALWKKRLGEAQGAQDIQLFIPEMRSFGWWFVSDKFDDQWAIEQLVEALRCAQITDPNHLVVERLAVISKNMPFEAVQCLELIIRGDQEGWEIHGWIEEAKTILFHAIETGGETAELAKDLVHYLGSRGYLQFRPLLQNA